MATVGKYGYKTGTFITKIFFFKFVYNFEYSVYVYIYMMFLSEVVVIGS